MRLARVPVRVEQIARKFSAGKRIPEFLRIEIARAEFRDDLVGIVGNIGLLDFHQSLRGVQHGVVGGLAAFSTCCSRTRFGLRTLRARQRSARNRSAITTSPAHSPTPWSLRLYSRGSPQSLKNERSPAGGLVRSSSMFFISTLPVRLTKSWKLSPLVRPAR